MKPKIILAILTLFSFTLQTNAWVEPGDTGNIVAPLNSSSTEQTKEGRLGIKGGLVLSINNSSKAGLTNLTDGLLIYNTDSKQLEIYSGGVWQNVGGGGGDSLPKGTIAFFNLSACPSGWTEKTELKGRYPIGLPTSGTLGQSVGTALNNGENRSVGQHNHGVTDPGHSHDLMGQDGMFGPGSYGHFI